jgi:hypothetical protein
MKSRMAGVILNTDWGSNATLGVLKSASLNNGEFEGACTTGVCAQAHSKASINTQIERKRLARIVISNLNRGQECCCVAL